MTDPLYTAHTSTLDATPPLPTDVEPCGCDHSQLREAQLIDALLASVRAQERAEQYRAECEVLRGELAAMRDNGPKHTRECGTAYRGCSPDCTYQADVEALHEKRRPSSTPDAAQPHPDLPRWSINHPDARPMEPEEVVCAKLTAAIARAEAAERELSMIAVELTSISDIWQRTGKKLCWPGMADYDKGRSKTLLDASQELSQLLRAALTPAQEKDR